MKKVKKLSNGIIEVSIDDVLESMYEVGDFIEFDGQDYMIIEKKDKKYLLK